MNKNLYPNLFSPVAVGNVTFKNRIMSAPNLLHRVVGGRPDEHYVRYLEHKARGGAAIINLGEAGVCDGAFHTMPMRMTEENLPIYGEMSAAIHEHGALAGAELTHGGINASAQFNSPGARLLGPVDCVSFRGDRISAMTGQDMEDVAGAFADAAEYWLRAGFDAVHVHAGHTWLFAQFLSPFINTRTDDFGGSFENRARFPLMVLKRMRERLGGRMIITLRQSGSERREGGFTTADVAFFLEKAQEYIDLVEITTEGWDMCMPCTFKPLGLNAELSGAIKKTGRLEIPVFVVGAINDPGLAEDIIASGKADGVSMARALIADPYLPLKAASGRPHDITPCLRCQNCVDEDNLRYHFRCSVNPLAGREARHGFGGELSPAKHKRRVLVVGGGPAGMKAAVTASLRGHEVTLCEKTGALGGLLNFTETDSLKHDLRRFKNHLIKQVYESDVRVLTDTEADDGLLARIRPEHIIVATGGTPIVPAFLKGYENAVSATDIYFDSQSVKGESIVIVGGGLVGVEAGLHLCNIGKKVTVLEMKDRCAEEAGGTYLIGLMAKAEEVGLNMITGARCVEIGREGVTYVREGIESRVLADTVFYAVGLQKNDAPYFDLAGKAMFTDHIGDCKKIGKVVDAIHAGYFSALDIGAVES